ncbi:bifunctional adenosylcobinamide kinase/adenosylcobinamide-phosphate guanylyltransferase, partial [Mesorhizobium sp. M0848]
MAASPAPRPACATALPDRKTLTFLIGGGRAGKSAPPQIQAPALAPPRAYIATAQPRADELGERIGGD